MTGDQASRPKTRESMVRELGLTKNRLALCEVLRQAAEDVGDKLLVTAYDTIIKACKKEIGQLEGEEDDLLNLG